VSTTPNRTFRIAIVEDEPLWQQGLQTLLSMDASLELAGVYVNPELALQGLLTDRVDLVLVDWKFPGGADGLTLANILTQNGYKPYQIIMITGSPEEQLPPHPYGYVSKPNIANNLLPTITFVCQQLG
jgi:DNA-binding NarL/FixJ family response regulator